MLIGAFCAVTANLAGCTHTLSFSDPSALVVVGTPPAPAPVHTEEKPAVSAVQPVAPVAPKRVEVQQNQIVIHDKIQFESGRAAIKAESSALLDEIVAVIKANSQLRRISVEGHTDSTGSDQHNQTLSEQRAAAVRDYLVAHGVEPGRLTSRGWGETRAVADNGTPAGREANRRVEFVILEQDMGNTSPVQAPSAAPTAPNTTPTAPVEGGAL
jgi:OOP family OmpA-OmpF porin